MPHICASLYLDRVINNITISSQKSILNNCYYVLKTCAKRAFFLKTFLAVVYDLKVSDTIFYVADSLYHHSILHMSGRISKFTFFQRDPKSSTWGLVMAAPDTQAHAWKSFAKYVEKKNEVFPNFSHAPDKNVANGNNATSFSAAWLPVQLNML